MPELIVEAGAVRKFAAHFRLDMNEQGHESVVAGLDALMAPCMLEPVRVSIWRHLMSRYYITDERGPKLAQAWALVCGDALVYHGPM
jgi:hypothetical protein